LRDGCACRDSNRPVDVPAQAEPPPEPDPGTSMVISGIQFRAACHKAGKDTILGVVVHFTASFRWIAAHACCVPAAAPRHPVPESTAASSKVSALPADVSGRVQAFANGFGPFLQHTTDPDFLHAVRFDFDKLQYTSCADGAPTLFCAVG